MKIYVTAEDIIDGEHGSCSSCPVVLAMRRAIGVAVRVDSFSYYLTGSDELFPLPTAAQRFIASFDAESGEDPFSFEIPDSAVAKLRGQAVPA